MNWYVLYLRPRCEKKLAEYCQIHGLSHYLPLRRETKIYQRRKVTVEKPLFPSYFFASFDGDGRTQVLKTNNVLRILEPSSRRKLLHELAQVRKALRVDPTLITVSAIRTGRRVRIKGGPFLGVEGVVMSLKGKAKVCLNVEMIGRALAMDVDREYLEVVD
jgi:transcriptional antiterminator RfaH